MANTNQSRKRARQNIVIGERNKSLRSLYRTMIKKVVAAVQSGKQDNAQAALREAVPIIDNMVNKGIIHQNKAARLKSRLVKKIKGMQG